MRLEVKNAFKFLERLSVWWIKIDEQMFAMYNERKESYVKKWRGWIEAMGRRCER